MLLTWRKALSTLGVLKVVLNGEPFDVDAPLTVSGLLTRLNIDPRGVAVEHNLVVLKKAEYSAAMVNEGDQVEIVRFVGGGEAPSRQRRRVAQKRRRDLEVRQCGGPEGPPYRWADWREEWTDHD
jgi:thiamine biosynthesis protein ThiS